MTFDQILPTEALRNSLPLFRCRWWPVSHDL